MAKPNYAFEKRQRELAKKKKKEEKASRKGPPGQPDSPEANEPAAAPLPMVSGPKPGPN